MDRLYEEFMDETKDVRVRLLKAQAYLPRYTEHLGNFCSHLFDFLPKEPITAEAFIGAWRNCRSYFRLEYGVSTRTLRAIAKRMVDVAAILSDDLASGVAERTEWPFKRSRKRAAARGAYQQYFDRASGRAVPY